MRPRIPAAVVLALLLGACSSQPTPEVARYLLAPELQSEGTPPTDGPVLRLAPVDVAPHLDGIVLLREGERVDRLVYHQWAGPLQTLAEAGLREALRATGRFRAVEDSASATAGDWILRARIRSLEIDDRGPDPVASCEIEATLRVEGRRALSWTGRERSRRPLEAGAGVERLVRALGAAFAEAATALARRAGDAILAPGAAAGG